MSDLFASGENGYIGNEALLGLEIGVAGIESLDGEPLGVADTGSDRLEMPAENDHLMG